jgi:ABC-type branched-subunit amino acid transport system ATPase component
MIADDRSNPVGSGLRASGVHKRFGGVQAVRDISLDVRHGEVFAIIGPNGAGKSTLLNLMSGVHQPDAGRIVFDGVDLVGLPAHRRARLGLARTFQKIRLFRRLSVLDNVVAAFHLHHDIPAWQYVVHGRAFARDYARCRAEAMKLLAFVGLQAQPSLPRWPMASSGCSSSLARLRPRPDCSWSTSLPPASTRRKWSGWWNASGSCESAA